ncbi:MAG: hypothetical protein COW30_00945 [Rhodospirillales bacterium CG15_BIG_FIL_POST_REV_8_21_14_020_66_15]|nr:MAG: hypothetical protein COW30_00945 [Rhodospirillales bacterium CG15_BIG_FIL_POST_REV_8_21_14_020_66_15]
MPVSVVFGGQFGSEGKGKVVHDLARLSGARVAVRVGGPNSGHTVIDKTGAERKFQSLPTASLLPDAVSVIAAGSYVDPLILISEIVQGGLSPDRVMVDPNAVLITDSLKTEELDSGLRGRIGSTLSGTGAAVKARILRDGSAAFASSDDRLKPFIRETREFMRGCLDRGERIIIEGTQGFGLSVIHSPEYPYVTTRDTSAAGFVSEAGLSPLDVDDVVMVLRAFPIRVAGNSGPLPNEIDWQTVRRESGYAEDVTEYTTVTGAIRRVARFDPAIVRKAIEANAPTRIVLNHVDYIDSSCRASHRLSARAEEFVAGVEVGIGASIDFIGFGPSGIVPRLHNSILPTASASSVQ